MKTRSIILLASMTIQVYCMSVSLVINDKNNRLLEERSKAFSNYIATPYNDMPLQQLYADIYNQKSAEMDKNSELCSKLLGYGFIWPNKKSTWVLVP